MNRRDFLRSSAYAGAMAIAAGCKFDRFDFGAGGSMHGFAMKPFERIRVGIVGLGLRGGTALNRLCRVIPGVDVTAICDLKEKRIAQKLSWVKDYKVKEPRVFRGPEGWKALCDWDGVDLVYVTVPWQMHAPVALRALRAGKIALVECPGVMTVDECWEVVETCEKVRVPCMMLENCVYGEMELLGRSLVRNGVLGDLVHGEGAYIHNIRHLLKTNGCSESEWRYFENQKHCGDQYPSHGMVPILKDMNVNCGDCLDYLVSLESCPGGSIYYKQHAVPADDPRRNDPPPAMGDINTTLIKTKLGKSILVQHDITSPRPYSRTDILVGTKGIFWGMPWRFRGEDHFRIGLEEKCGENVHDFLPEKEAEALRQKYMHPLWAKRPIKGDCDFLMDYRWSYCLQNGLPLDMDVYDLATSGCICELSEKSVLNRSTSYDIPDFTRGAWKTLKPTPEWDFTAAPPDMKGTNINAPDHVLDRPA